MTDNERADAANAHDYIGLVCLAPDKRYVLFTGSREWTDYLTIYSVVRKLHVLLGSFTALHGGARGADTFVGLAARSNKLPERAERVTSEEWEKGGKSAGHYRNSRMLAMKPLMVVAFWDGSSRGTLDTIRKAVNIFRLPTVIYRLDQWTDNNDERGER